MAFTGREDNTIPISEGSALTKNFRKKFDKQPQGYFFSKATLESILNQAECVGIRFYFGLSDDEKLKLVFVGAKANEDDILAIVGDTGSICPPACGNSNPLNS